MRPTDLPLTQRLLLRAYQWRRAAAVPAARMRRPMSEARVALVTSGGLVAPGDAAFDLAMRGGDFSFRVIHGDAELPRLDVQHRSDAFDRAPGDADRNVVFPLDRLRELAESREIGSVAPRHLSFMGSITAPSRLVARSAPAAADQLEHDGVDVALLVPV